MERMTRREFLTALAGGAAGLFAAGAATAQPAAPKGTGEFKGYQVKPLLYAPGSLRGISEEVVNFHHGTHYAGYVKKRTAIDELLTKISPGVEGFDARLYAGIKRDEAFNAAGMILHEVYFDNLGGDGKPGNGALEQAIAARFGSLDRWVAEMTAAGSQATGWALLCHDPSDGRLHVYLVDGHQLGGIWGAVPIVALDVFEHAYYKDYGPDRGKYMAAFFDNLHWGRLNERYAAAAK